MKAATHRRSNSEVGIFALAPGDPLYLYQEDLRNRIACHASKLFETEGCRHGHDVEHWLRTEAAFLLPLQTRVREIDNWIFIGASVPETADLELRIYAEPLRIFITGKSKRNSAHQPSGQITREIFTSVDLPAPITLGGSFAELRHGVLTIGFSKLEKQLDKTATAIGESLAKAHKQHLRADKLKARSCVAKEYAKAAREHVGRASKKQERARHFLVTARSSKALLTVPPVPNWTDEMPHSPVD